MTFWRIEEWQVWIEIQYWKTKKKNSDGGGGKSPLLYTIKHISYDLDSSKRYYIPESEFKLFFFLSFFYPDSVYDMYICTQPVWRLLDYYYIV